MDEQTVIVTSDGPTWAAVPYALIDDETLSCQAKALYLVLARHANFKTGEAYPSYETLGAKAGIKSTATVAKALKELVAGGYVKKARSQSYNIYHLPSQWGADPRLHEVKSQALVDEIPESQASRGEIRGLHEVKGNDIQLTTEEKNCADAPPASDHHTFIAELCRLHKEVTGDKFIFHGRKHGAMVKRLLKNLDLETAVGKLRKYYTEQRWFTDDGGFSLESFVGHINEINSSGGSKLTREEAIKKELRS